MNNLLLNILFLSKSYLLGSILPSYFLTMAKDEGLIIFNSEFSYFQEELNEFYPNHRLLINLFDGFKGIFALFLAQFMGVNIFFLQLAGIAIIIGHKFPIYNGFEGGKLMPLLKGLIFFYLLNYVFINSELLINVIFLFIIFGISSHLRILGNIFEVIGSLLEGINIFFNFYQHPYTPIFELFIGIIILLNLIQLFSRESDIVEKQNYNTKKKAQKLEEEELLISLIMCHS
ncbi:MAG: membrane protein of unknown function [Promethearchaeota archaeon]|nr:MAG: membrane protein of unknown function [Candidatus Lokiarchaeota archaeon]